jgi:hypothetical protein
MGGKKKNMDVWNEFTFLYPKGHKGNAKAVYKYKYCSAKYTENTYTFKEHLLKCKTYKDLMEDTGRDNSVTIQAGRASKK